MTISPAFAKEQKDEASINLCCGDKFISPDVSEPLSSFLHTNYADPKPIQLKGGYEAKELPPVHLVHVLTKKDDQERLSKPLKEICDKFGYTFTRNLPTDMAITHPQASKADGLEALCKKRGLELGKHVVALGDSGNDVSMVKAAAIGVAMSNARDELKNVADFVGGGNGDTPQGVVSVLRALPGFEQ